MRFRIASPGKGSAVYQLRFQESIVSVRYPPVQRQRTFREKLAWTWPDGREYSLVVPYGGNAPLAHIYSGESRFCSGRGICDTQQQVLMPGNTVPIVEWNLNDRVVTCEGGAICCRTFPRTWTLRQDDGKRLVFWRARCGGYEGVWSESLSEDTVPIIAGIVLAQIHDWY